MHSKGEDSITAAGLAVMTISVVFFANIFTIGAFLRKANILNRFMNRPREAIFLMIVLLFINYFLFMHKKKYLNIKELFDNENRQKRIIGSTIVFLYCFISFILLLALAAYKPGYM